MTIRGREFSSSEEGSGVWFDGPRLESGVDQLIMSVTWSCRKTSGGGERTSQDNGEGMTSSNVWVRLMRGTEVVSECEEVFGSVGGEEMARHVVLVDQDVVRKAREGDSFRFMRRVARGEQLGVRRFTAVVHLTVRSTKDILPKHQQFKYFGGRIHKINKPFLKSYSF